MSNNTPFENEFELNNPFLNMQVDKGHFNQELLESQTNTVRCTILELEEFSSSNRTSDCVCLRFQ